MIRQKSWALVVGLIIICIGDSAYASPDYYLGCAMPVSVANGYAENFIWTSSATNSVCNSRIYIDREDKEIMAVALTAAMANRKMQIYFENAAPSVSYPESSVSTTCKAKRVNIDYYQSGSACTGYGF